MNTHNPIEIFQIRDISAAYAASLRFSQPGSGRTLRRPQRANILFAKKWSGCEPEHRVRSWASQSVHEWSLVTAHWYRIEKMKCFVLLNLQNFGAEKAVHLY
jgi:hypothetical protein